MPQALKVYIGYDPTEHDAYEVAKHSLLRHASIPVSVIPLDASALRKQGLLWRPTDNRGGIYDLYSNAPASTEFAVSRFLTPILAQFGPALFIDCDVVFLRDVAELLDEYDPRNAVQCVQHDYDPRTNWKMGEVKQTRYPRKNWSSVMLFNAGHDANRRLSVEAVNRWPGRDLHGFDWLADSEIGELSACWNWLVGEQPKPDHPGIAHFTLGGPWLPHWVPAQHDSIWLDAYEVLHERV